MNEEAITTQINVKSRDEDGLISECRPVNWEPLAISPREWLRRMPVQGGWLVQSGGQIASTLLFLADANHDWQLDYNEMESAAPIPAEAPPAGIEAPDPTTGVDADGQPAETVAVEAVPFGIGDVVRAVCDTGGVKAGSLALVNGLGKDTNDGRAIACVHWYGTAVGDESDIWAEDLALAE